MEIRKYREKDIPAMISIWNKVVEDGEAFPQEDFERYNRCRLFAAQTYCGVADNNGKIVGLYILHQTILAAVGILQTRVMLLITITEASILVKN